MRPQNKIGLLISIMGLALLGSSYAEEAEAGKPNMANDPLPTIYIEYRENNFYPERSRYNTMNEQDRLYYLKRNFEKVFAKENWGVNFEYKLYPVKDREDLDVLEITLLSFDARNALELELRTWARIWRKISGCSPFVTCLVLSPLRVLLNGISMRSTPDSQRILRRI